MQLAQNLVQILERDFHGNEELKNITFIKLSNQININHTLYLNNILQIIRNNLSNIRKRNLFDLLKLMISQTYLDFTSKFVKTIFEQLVDQAKKGDNQQFQIAIIMLTNENLQLEYLPYLTDCLGKNSQNQVNFSMALFQRLLFKTIKILEGKTRGPIISQKSINNLIKLSNQMAENRRLVFLNNVDHQNFLLICIHSLQLSRKYSSISQHILNPYQKIWKHQITNFQSATCRQVNAIYGILLQLLNFNTKNLIEQLQNQQIIHLIIQSSSYFILKCENINKFWHAYISQRQKMSNLVLDKFKSHQIVSIFTQNIAYFSNSMSEVVQKLRIVDNFIVLTKILTNIQHLRNFHQRQKMINPEDQIHIKLFSLSFQALYTPKFSMGDQQFILNYLFAQMQEITAKLIIEKQNKFQHCLEFFNYLPSLKILIIKCQKILTQEKFMQTIILFLFMFLDNQSYFECFQEFINLCCKSYLKQINSLGTSQYQKDKIKYLYTRANNIFKRCVSYLKKDDKLTKITNHLRVIQTIFKMTNHWQYKQIFPNISQLIELAEHRHIYYDQHLILLIKRLVKGSTKEHFGKIQCFNKLCQLIIKDKRILYLQVLFDFAQTHNCKQIYEIMNKNKEEISYACRNSPILQQSILRNISYNVMTQIIHKDTSSTKIVGIQLQQIIQKLQFKPKIYNEVLQIASKQYNMIKKLSKNTQKPTQSLIKFIQVLIRMLQRLNNTMQQNNICSKNQKITLIKRIADQLLQYTYTTTRIKDYQPTKLIILIEGIRRFIRLNKMKNFKQMKRPILILTIAYLDMEKNISNKLKHNQGNTEQEILRILALSKEVKDKSAYQVDLLNIGLAKKFVNKG